MIDLKYLIENDAFIVCSPLTADLFVSYCKDRGVEVSRQDLEEFERLQLLFPLARVRYPTIKNKVKYTDDGKGVQHLGKLKENEEWEGDVKEEYAYFEFSQKYAEGWIEEGLLWDPSSRPFAAWDTFRDERGYCHTESFYSVFQCYDVYHLISSTRMRVNINDYFNANTDFSQFVNKIKDFAAKLIPSLQRHRDQSEERVALYQALANRYFPQTQSDRRTITVTSQRSPYIGATGQEWDWNEYCKSWDAKTVLAVSNIEAEAIKKVYESLFVQAQILDPLAHWYDLLSFVAVQKKKTLKGHALLAQSLYAMTEMLRLFYQDVTEQEVPTLGDSLYLDKDGRYGKGVTGNELQMLEFVTNEYHLNPKPKLILVVEGDGEEEQIPRLAKSLGYPFPKLGIRLDNIRGVGNFTGNKRQERYGALEKFIDDNHSRQTIVFVLLDNEGRVQTIKERLVKTPSKFNPGRTIIKEDHIHLWDKTIEFDNFSHREIVWAMTKLSQGRYQFTEVDISWCEQEISAKKKDPLARIFKDKIGEDGPRFSKKALLKLLFDHIESSLEQEFDADGKGKRPIVQTLMKVIELAALNHQPVTRDIAEKNQASGYFGARVEEEI